MSFSNYESWRDVDVGLLALDVYCIVRNERKVIQHEDSESHVNKAEGINICNVGNAQSYILHFTSNLFQFDWARPFTSRSGYNASETQKGP